MIIDIPKTGHPVVDAVIIMSVAIVICASTGVYIYKAVGRKLSELAEQMHLVGKDVEAAKHQVKNDHGTNLRDDMDDMRDRLDLILAEQSRQGEKQREMGETIRTSLAESAQLRTHLEGVRVEMRHERERVDNILLAHTGVLPVVRAARKEG